MEGTTDRRHPVQMAVGSLERSHLWVPGLAVDDNATLVAPLKREDSYLGECECPGDCLRDHANE